MAGTVVLSVLKSTLVSTVVIFFCRSISYDECRIPDVLDGMLIVLAMYTLNFFHPGLLLPASVWKKPKKALENMSNDKDMEVGRSQFGKDISPPMWQ